MRRSGVPGLSLPPQLVFPGQCFRNTSIWHSTSGTFLTRQETLFLSTALLPRLPDGLVAVPAVSHPQLRRGGKV